MTSEAFEGDRVFADRSVFRQNERLGMTIELTIYVHLLLTRIEG